MPIQMYATPYRNGVPTRDPASFLRILSQRLPTYAIQSPGYIVVDG
jgi:hypothetical protein